MPRGRYEKSDPEEPLIHQLAWMTRFSNFL